MSDEHLSPAPVDPPDDLPRDAEWCPDCQDGTVVCPDCGGTGEVEGEVCECATKHNRAGKGRRYCRMCKGEGWHFPACKEK